MSKKTKQATKKDKRRAVRRQERRFVSQASTNATVVRALGALSAMCLGGGAWGYLYAQSFADDDKLKAVPAYLIAGGAVLLGLTIWFGTSSEPPVRVGAPGIAVEKGDLRRMAWWGVDKISLESGTLTLLVEGTDESNVAWTFKVPLKSHPEAVPWIVREAQERIPSRVDIPEEQLAQLPGTSEQAGTIVDLEPLQVVGRKDALSGTTISYEPDACVCARCERVYLKRSVPKKCKCGNSLAHLRPKDAENVDMVEEVDEDDAPASSQRSEKSEAAEETAES